LATPGLDIRLMFGRVRDTVAELTNRQQEPFVYGSIGGREVILRPAAGAPPSASAQPVFDPRAIQLSFWESVRHSNSAPLVRTYLERYPSGAFATLARARIQEIEQQQRLANLPSTTPPAGGSTQTATVPQIPVAPPTGGVLRVGVGGPMTGPNAAFGVQIRR